MVVWSVIMDDSKINQIYNSQLRRWVELSKDLNEPESVIIGTPKQPLTKNLTIY